MQYNRKLVNIKETVDHKTGEITRHESKFIKKVKSEEFIKIYLEDMAGFMKISSGMEFKVLFWIWKMTGWNNSPIIIDKVIKDEFANTLGIKTQSVSDTLSRLVKKNILIKNARLRYSLNPTYFFKGDDKAREEILDLHIQYKIEK